MTRYAMDDGTVVDTDRATAHWDEQTRWNGNNHISVPTGSQWHHQTLYRSRKGRYYIEHTSQWQGERSYVTWVDHREAAAWLLSNDEELPEDLAVLADEIVE